MVSMRISLFHLLSLHPRANATSAEKHEQLHIWSIANKTTANGYIINSFETFEAYAAKLLNCNYLPATMEVRAPLWIALNFVSIRQLTTVLAIKLEELYFCAPRLLTLTNPLNVSSTEVVIFKKNTITSLIIAPKWRCLEQDECTPLLKACKINSTLPIIGRAARYVASYILYTWSNTDFTFKGHKGILSAITYT